MLPKVKPAILHERWETVRFSICVTQFKLVNTYAISRHPLLPIVERIFFIIEVISNPTCTWILISVV